MDVTYRPSKDVRNKRLHGISLARARDFDFESAKFVLDDSQDYGEERWLALGFLAATLHVLVFTETATGIHAISLRKAEPSERIEYAQD
jgi:uncharacterized protein